MRSNPEHTALRLDEYNFESTRSRKEIRLLDTSRSHRPDPIPRSGSLHPLGHATHGGTAGRDRLWPGRVVTGCQRPQKTEIPPAVFTRFITYRVNAEWLPVLRELTHRCCSLSLLPTVTEETVTRHFGIFCPPPVRRFTTPRVPVRPCFPLTMTILFDHRA